MNQSADLHGKVIYYKGRVWTIYALTGNHDGVFAFQGLKPYTSYQYNSYRSDRNIVYVRMQDALQCIIDSDQIETCVKAENKAQSKDLNKKMAVEFLAGLTGHSKSKISDRIEERFSGFSIMLGQANYDLFKLDGRLHLLHNLHGTTDGTTFDFVTLQHDNHYEDKQRQKERQDEAENIIEDYKHKYQCKCDGLK